MQLGRSIYEQRRAIVSEMDFVAIATKPIIRR